MRQCLIASLFHSKKRKTYEVISSDLFRCLFSQFYLFTFACSFARFFSRVLVGRVGTPCQVNISQEWGKFVAASHLG